MIVRNENGQKQKLADRCTFDWYRQRHPLAQPVDHVVGAHVDGIQTTNVAGSHQSVQWHIVDATLASNGQIHVMYDERMIRQSITFAQATVDTVQAAQM